MDKVNLICDGCKEPLTFLTGTNEVTFLKHGQGIKVRFYLCDKCIPKFPELIDLAITKRNIFIDDNKE